MQFIDIYDFLLLPLYLGIFYWLIVLRAKKMSSPDHRKFFINAFLFHMAGSFLYCLVVQYYYGYGDSFGFYMGGNFLRRVIQMDGSPFNAIIMTGEGFAKKSAIGGLGDLELPTGIQTTSNLMVMKVSALFSYLSFNSYVIISLFFGLISFAGIWRLFCVFTDVVGRKQEKILAFIILYMPSACFWGTGLIKDSLCLGFLGFTVSGIYNIAIKKEHSLKSVFFVAISFYFLFLIKSYIAGALAVAMMLGYVLQIIIKSKDNFIKLAGVILVMIGISVFVVINTSSAMESLVEESRDQIEIFKGAYSSASNDDERSVGSFTSADFDFSVSGLVLRSPTAVFTTLFRPFLWETRKPIMLFSALESFLNLLATVYIILKFGIHRFFPVIFSNPYIFICFIFSIILAAIVGFTTFNFGTLVRYRLPVLPFYYFMLFAIYVKQTAKTSGNT